MKPYHKLEKLKTIFFNQGFAVGFEKGVFLTSNKLKARLYSTGEVKHILYQAALTFYKKGQNRSGFNFNDWVNNNLK